MNSVISFLIVGLIFGNPLNYVLDTASSPIYLLDTYSDLFNNFTHVLYRANGETGFWYMKLESAAPGKIVVKLNFPQTSVLLAKIRPTDKTGKNFILVLQTLYKKLFKESIWYSETSDGGESWSTFKQIVQDTDSESDCRRCGDNLITNLESGRVFIFFVKECLQKRTLNFVTRTPGSLIFSQEYSISLGLFPLNPSIVSATLAQNNILHLVWANFNNEEMYLYYSKSRTNGADWSIPKSISIYPYFGYNTLHTDMQVASNGIPYFIIMYPKLNDAPYQMIYSTDEGNTFSSGKDFIKEIQEVGYWEYKVIGTCGYSEGEKVNVVGMVANKDDNVEMVEWDLKKGVWEKIRHPFGKCYAGKVSCIGKSILAIATKADENESGKWKMEIAFLS